MIAMTIVIKNASKLKVFSGKLDNNGSDNDRCTILYLMMATM